MTKLYCFGSHFETTECHAIAKRLKEAFFELLEIDSELARLRQENERYEYKMKVLSTVDRMENDLPIV